MFKKIKQFHKKVKSKGMVFRLLFYFFFLMFFVPLLIFLGLAFYKGNIPWLIILLTLLGAFMYEIRHNRLYQTCLLMVISNMLLWFVMGLMPFIQNILSWLPGFFTYILLIPYALISGGMTHMLLWKSTYDARKTLRGFVLISMMIALVAVTTDIIRSLATNVSDNIEKVSTITPWLSIITEGLLQGPLYNPVIGFFLILVMFNFGTILRYVHERKSARGLLLYAVPIALFFMFRWMITLF